MDSSVPVLNPGENNTLTALDGVTVGHCTDEAGHTGVSVICFDDQYPVAYCSYGGGPSTFNTDTLANGRGFVRRRALFLAGGSLLGLGCGVSLAQALVDDGCGDMVGVMAAPSVTGAVILDIGTRIGRFNPDMARLAYAGRSKNAVESGNVGVGTGASCGKFSLVDSGDGIAMPAPSKSGVGSALVVLPGGVVVAAMSVVNPYGNVIGRDGSILAGNRSGNEKGFIDFHQTGAAYCASEFGGDMGPGDVSGGNTTLSVVGINARLGSQGHYQSVAHQASLGMSRAISPVNTSVDGDCVFVFSTEENTAYLESRGHYLGDQLWPVRAVDLIGDCAAWAVQESIYDACRSACSVEYGGFLGGLLPGLAIS
jgi:L-aminopeptidase/D-esterase-like protein